MYFTTAVATAIGLFGINVAAQGLGQTAICPFDGNRGPNILVAVVHLPDGGTEIDAWLYGYNWCSHSNFVSSSGDICSDTGGTEDAVEFMHAPFTNKFGAFDPICYANIDIRFFGCQPSENGSQNYDNVVAWITSKPQNSFGSSAIDAAPQFGPQQGRFGQPPQGAIPPSQAGPQAFSGQSNNEQQFNGQQFGGQQSSGQQPPSQNGKRQQSQSQGNFGQSQNQRMGGTLPGQFSQNNNLPQGLNPQSQGFNPQSSDQQLNPQQQGQFNPQQNSQFNPEQQSQFDPQQQGQFNPQQGQSGFPQVQQQQQQQGPYGGQPWQYGGGQGGQGQSPWGGQGGSSYLYHCAVIESIAAARTIPRWILPLRPSSLPSSA